MQKTKLTRLLTYILCLVLIAVMALCTSGCNGKSDKNEDSGNKTEQTAESPETNEQAKADENDETNELARPEESGDRILGTGATVFTFSVIDTDGTETSFEIHTDKKTVGDALLELGLIDGEDGPYGLYVKKVNGKTLDYNKDGKYWAFYENGKYAAAGVDTTDIVAGTAYSFKAE